MDDFDTFFPAPRKRQIGEFETEILPLKMSRVGAFAKAVRPVMSRLQAGDYIGAAESHYDDLRQALIVAIEASEKDIDALTLPDFIDLLVDVVEVNLSFFVVRVVPQLNTLAQLIGGQRPTQATPMSSPASSDPGTASSTSGT